MLVAISALWQAGQRKDRRYPQRMLPLRGVVKLLPAAALPPAAHSLFMAASLWLKRGDDEGDLGARWAWGPCLSFEAVIRPLSYMTQ